MWWRGRMRGGGAAVLLESVWVRQHFKPHASHGPKPSSVCLLSRPSARLGRPQVVPRVGAAGGRALQARPDGQRAAAAGGATAGLGGHWDGPEALSAPGASASAGAILTVECPVVAYRQGAADLCAAYGLASALHEYGDASGGAAIAACARAALTVSPVARTIAGRGYCRPARCRWSARDSTLRTVA